MIEISTIDELKTLHRPGDLIELGSNGERFVFFKIIKKKDHLFEIEGFCLRCQNQPFFVGKVCRWLFPERIAFAKLRILRDF